MQLNFVHLSHDISFMTYIQYLPDSSYLSNIYLNPFDLCISPKHIDSKWLLTEFTHELVFSNNLIQKTYFQLGQVGNMIYWIGFLHISQRFCKLHWSIAKCEEFIFQRVMYWYLVKIDKRGHKKFSQQERVREVGVNKVKHVSLMFDLFEGLMCWYTHTFLKIK